MNNRQLTVHYDEVDLVLTTGTTRNRLCITMVSVLSPHHHSMAALLSLLPVHNPSQIPALTSLFYARRYLLPLLALGPNFHPFVINHY